MAKPTKPQATASAKAVVANPMGNVVEEDDFLDDIGGEIASQNTKEKTRQENARFHWLFRMPEQAENDGTRRAGIRFITPFSQPTKLLIHNMYNEFTVVCPREYGLECQYCKKPQEEQEKFNHTWYLWQVWNYLGGKEHDGGAELFAWEVNGASPIPGLHQQFGSAVDDKLKEIAEDEGLDIHDNDVLKAVKRRATQATAADWAGRDIVLIQNGEKAKRTFQSVLKNPRPQKFPEQKVWDAQERKDSFTFIKSKPDARKLLLGIDREEKQAAVVSNKSRSILDDLDDE